MAIYGIKPVLKGRYYNGQLWWVHINGGCGCSQDPYKLSWDAQCWYGIRQRKSNTSNGRHQV